MTLNLDKSDWKYVTLGDVASASKEKCDPESGTVERYVAGEHMNTDGLKIHRWGVVGDGYLGPGFSIAGSVLDRFFTGRAGPTSARWPSPTSMGSVLTRPS